MSMSTNTSKRQHDNLFIANDQDFEEQVLRSPLPVVVDFTAAWCPPCRALEPVYERLSAEYVGRLRFARIDVDENLAVPARYSVQAFPTLLVFNKGEATSRIVGPHPGRLQRGLDKILAELEISAE